jgi:hypothetical protein
LDPKLVLDIKNVPFASKISSSNVLSHDSKAPKVSEKYNSHDFYPKDFNPIFLPKTDFGVYRN